MKKSTTVSKQKSARGLRHESEQNDNTLETLQWNRDFTQIILKSKETEWSGDFDPELWSMSSKTLVRLSYTGIHPVPLTTYGYDLRTGQRIEGKAWDEFIAAEEKRRSRYRRASGKGWDDTRGLIEFTVSYRPDLLWVLKLSGKPALVQAWMDGNLKKIAAKVAEIGKLPCPIIMAHNAKSINHVHPRVISVDDDGELLWPRDAEGKIPVGKKGLNLLGAPKLAIMRLVRSGLIEGDEYAERCFENRCRATASKTSNGLPLDWSVTTWLDDETEAFIRSFGPKAVETMKVIREDYKRHLNGRMSGSSFNIKGQMKALMDENRMLRGRQSAMEAKMDRLLALLERKPTELLVPVAPLSKPLMGVQEVVGTAIAGGTHFHIETRDALGANGLALPVQPYDQPIKAGPVARCIEACTTRRGVLDIRRSAEQAVRVGTQLHHSGLSAEVLACIPRPTIADAALEALGRHESSATVAEVRRTIYEDAIEAAKEIAARAADDESMTVLQKNEPEPKKVVVAPAKALVPEILPILDTTPVKSDEEDEKPVEVDDFLAAINAIGHDIG